jgi:hypothetical protein
LEAGNTRLQNELTEKLTMKNATPEIPLPVLIALLIAGQKAVAIS